ncbi:MAG: hypothetical protein AAGD06_24815 [Acidobacteriota bacterium]
MTRRLGVRALLLAFLAWTGVQGAREAYRSAWFTVADPWPAESPVLWPVDGGHVDRLEGLVSRLRPCLPENGSPGEGTVALTVDPALGDQAFYLRMWLAYLLPEHDLRPVDLPAVPGEATWLVYGHGAVPATVVVPQGLAPACRTAGSAVYRSVPVTTGPGSTAG